MFGLNIIVNFCTFLYKTRIIDALRTPLLLSVYLYLFYFKKKMNKEKNEFCMSNDYGSKINLIASKFFVDVDF